MNETVMLKRKAKMQLSRNWLNGAIAALIYCLILMVASSIAYIGELILIGPMLLGLTLYITCLADTHRSDFGLLFKGFDRFVETLVAGLIYLLAVTVGSCLLIVPGIILACGFSMTFYIMMDDPRISGVDAIKKSWQMMDHHKWEYFCVMFSFIGWILLCLLTLGIGYLWLIPYMKMTELNYYRKLRYGTY